MATQATHQSDRDESMEVTPIRGAESTPPTPFDPHQVMNPNLGAGMASGSTQEAAEQGVDQATARAILQSWSEVAGEDGVCGANIHAMCPDMAVD